MLYIGSKEEQCTALLIALEGFAEGYKSNATEMVRDMRVDTAQVEAIVYAINENFPHCDGVEAASGFKKAANLVAHIVNMQPILEVEFIDDIDQHYLHKNSHVLAKYDPNAVFALHLAIALLQNHSMFRTDGHNIRPEDINKIALTKHSYLDILNVLSTLKIQPKEHFALITLVLEQTFYKTNPNCQYNDFVFGPSEYIESVSRSKATSQYDEANTG